METLALQHIFKKYPDGSEAVKDFNLLVEAKEFIVLVGPSGCGKSTTLRMIAGLEDISEGELRIGGKVMNDVPSKNRDIAMVFQNYALYPHMSIYDNMAFGLKLRKFPKKEIRERVLEAAEILELTPHLKKKPAALSGGQRQRVALGRAIVRDAQLFLMDEPLSNLDAKLRVQMRAEISKLHQRLETTTVYVTHDQTEAMTMATRLVVMKDGIVQQIGTPKDVYLNPNNMFVGGFIGSPAMNFVKGTIDGNTLVIDDYRFTLPEDKKTLLHEQGYNGKELYVGIRPEFIHYETTPTTETFPALIQVSELTGSELMLHSTIGASEQKFVAKVDAAHDIERDTTVQLRFDLAKAQFFDMTTETRIHDAPLIVQDEVTN